MSNGSSLLRNDSVKIAKSAALKGYLRTLVSVLLWTGIVFLVIYFCFAATLLRVVPSLSGTGPVFIKNATVEGGMFPSGHEVLVDPTRENEGGVMDNLYVSFVPSSDYQEVEIISGPYGEFSVDGDGAVTVDGGETGLVMHEMFSEDRDDEVLRDEYIAECLSGACEEGQAVIVPVENIAGEKVYVSDFLPFLSDGPVEEDES